MEFIARLSSPDAPASAVIPNDRIGIDRSGESMRRIVSGPFSYRNADFSPTERRSVNAAAFSGVIQRKFQAISAKVRLAG